MTDYGVYLAGQDGGRPAFEKVMAETPQKAAFLAQRLHPGLRAYAVTSRLEIVGECRRCRVMVLAHERHARYGSEIRCDDCR